MTDMVSQGIILSMGTGTPVVIGKLVNFSGPGGGATIIDSTSLDSVAKEKTMGLPDEGDFQFEINYDSKNTGHKAFIAARAARTLKTFTITFPNADVVTFSGYATEFSVKGAVDALVTATGSIAITGAVTWPA